METTPEEVPVDDPTEDDSDELDTEDTDDGDDGDEGAGEAEAPTGP